MVQIDTLTERTEVMQFYQLIGEQLERAALKYGDRLKILILPVHEYPGNTAVRLSVKRHSGGRWNAQRTFNNLGLGQDSGREMSACFEDMFYAIDNESRVCGFCSREPTIDGHDGCLGTLPGVMNACCGHGEISLAYIQFENGGLVRGEAAVRMIDERSLKLV